MGKQAKITIHPKFTIGEISPRLFSAFLEPIGTMVNGTMYNPKHPTADEQGFRTDVINSLKDTGVTAVRLPGGNFVSGWEWKDSIGPMAERKAHLDLAWHQYIPNDVGHDEYLQWAEKVGTEPMYTINLGTDRIKDAIHIAEYTNHEGGTYWSDLRKKYGHAKPYGVKTWYLGNEMDGPWQIGSWEKDPKSYGVLANEVSKAMKWVDGRIETAVCGSSSPFMEHFPEWDLQVLEQCYHSVDYISMHHYHSAAPGNYAQLLGGAAYYEDYIHSMIALCDYVKAKTRSPRKLMLSFDEYGAMKRPLKGIEHPAWGQYNMYAAHYRFHPDQGYVRHDPDNMVDVRWMREIGDMEVALGNTSILFGFIRHADRVKIGCMTSGLSTLCASNHDHVWKSAAHYPIAHLMKYAKGCSMQASVEGETFDLAGYIIDDTQQYPDKNGLPFVDTVAAYDKQSGDLNVFLINRNWEDDTKITLDVSGFEDLKFAEHIHMYSEDMSLRNTYEAQETIVPTINEGSEFKDGKLHATLKKLSWNVIRFTK